MKQLQPGAVDDQDSNKVLFQNIVPFLCFVTKNLDSYCVCFGNKLDWKND